MLKTMIALILLGAAAALPAYAQMAPGRGTAPTAHPAPATAQASATGAPRTSAAGQFTTEAAAKAHCPTDTIVWANLSSKAYHTSSERYYGKTKRGAYMCLKEAEAAGFHAPGARASKTATKTGGGSAPTTTKK
jgi:hypothetical protein